MPTGNPTSIGRRDRVGLIHFKPHNPVQMFSSNSWSSFLMQKHDPPTSSIPCLHYKKMKEQEERELNGEVTLNAEEFPVKTSVEANGDEGGGEPEATTGDEVPPSVQAEGGPEGESSTRNSLQACDIAQGALGQVKAKVEVCKDESIGKGFS